jgi:cytochrome c-type biogenesis protein CcmH
VRNVLFACMLALAAAPAWSGEALPASADPVLEKRVMALSEELRCLVCQNQTIADSHAELAIDLKNQVREKLAQGMSDKDVIDYMVQRYGDFVLYRPPVKGITWLLWFGPFLLLVGALGVLGVKLSRRRVPVDGLSESEMERAAQLLGAAPHLKDSK